MILGISAFYHDAAAALLVDGQLVAFAKEERFTRMKHHAGLPKNAINYCLETAKIKAEDLTKIVFYEDPTIKFTRILISLLSDFPNSFSAFLEAMKSWLTDKIWIKNEISSFLDITPDKITFVPHHFSHIAQGVLLAPFGKTAYLTMDAVGEWSTMSAGLALKESTYKVLVHREDIYPNSIGLVYSAFTAFLGFKPNSQECNTMALAAFGRPTFKEQIQQIIHLENGSLKIDQSYFNFYSKKGKELFTKKFEKVFDKPRPKTLNIGYDTLSEEPFQFETTKPISKYANIAASIQVVIEELLLEICADLKQSTKCDRLCIAGGVALNAVAMGRLYREGTFSEVFIPPAPGDGGAAIGAALHYDFNNKTPKNQQLNQLPYLGQSYSSNRIAKMLEQVSLEDWENLQLEGTKSPIKDSLSYKQVDDFSKLTEEVSKDLMNGKIVGWFQGRFESGPRALGNRSILAHPSKLSVARRLSAKVKLREAYRPYALSITEEDSHKLFEFRDGKIPEPARWMQLVFPVKEENCSIVKSALHIDQTTRPQIVSTNYNERYHQLLAAFGQRYGVSAVLNTSFNEKGYPIVSTPEEALLVFARTEMDVLVVNNFIIKKNYGTNH